MSNSPLPNASLPSPLPQQSLSLTFKPKNSNSIEEILETLKSQCISFDSFKDLKNSLFYQVFTRLLLIFFKKIAFFPKITFFFKFSQFSEENNEIHEALTLFRKELIETLICMGFNEEDELCSEKIKDFEEKMIKEPEIFRETCRIYHNIHYLSGNNIVKNHFFTKKFLS